LTKFKFKNWVTTETRGIPVTEAMKEERAAEIARTLNDTGRWHSHSRGIPMEVVRRDLNLQIEDFGENPELSKCIRHYYKLLNDYMARRGHTDVMHVPRKYASIWEEG
jgi:hypothetical protein